MDIDNNKNKNKRKVVKGVDDNDDESTKKPTTLSNLPVLADDRTQGQKQSSQPIASKKSLPSATNTRQTSTSDCSDDYNNCEISHEDVGHNNSIVTTESILLLEKQRIAGRRDIINTIKQEAFAEEATIEELTQGIHHEMTTGPSILIKETKMDTSFAEEVPVQEATSGTIDDKIKGSHKSDKMTMIDRSKKNTQGMKLSIMPMANHSHCLNQHSMQSHDPMMSNKQLEITQPGALALFPPGNVGSEPSTFNDDTTSIQDESQHQQLTSIEDSDVEAQEPALNAALVSEDLASATILDIEAEKKFHQKRRMRTMVGTLIIASIIAIAVAIPVVLTRPGPPPATFSSSSSPGPSATPSFLPTVRPSIQPSWVPSSSPSSGLFGFLAENSFDGGIMLAIAGSSQQRAMEWLLEVSGLSELDYSLLQAYALVTLYFETKGEQWISKVNFDEKRLDLGSFPNKDSDYIGEWLNITSSVNPNGFCDWQGVLCNDKREIESLTLSSNRLFNSLPAEIGMLHQSLSKFTILLA